MVHLSQQLYQRWYFILSKTHVFSFPWCSFPFPGFFPGHQITTSLVVACPLVPLAVTVSYRMSAVGSCLLFFSWWGRLMCFWEEDQRGRGPFSPHTKCTYLSAWLTSVVNLDHLAGVKHSSSFSVVKLLFSLSFLLLLSRRKLLYTAHSYASLPEEWSVYKNYLISCVF